MENLNVIYCGKCNKPKGKEEGSCKCGRPTDYSEEILIKTREYIDNCEDEDVQKVKQSNEEKGYEMYENKVKVKLPTIEGLARYLGINKTTIYEWCKIHSEFSNYIDELMAKQAERLVNNGLSGDYNSTIAKVLLTKHGYREGIDQTTNDKDLPVPIYGGQSSTTKDV